MTTNQVGRDQLLADANFFEDQLHQGLGILTEYQNAGHDLQAGGLVGTAGLANLRTTEEVHQAAAKLHNAWGGLVDELRNQCGNYDSHDHSTAQQIAAVAGAGSELRFS